MPSSLLVIEHFRPPAAHKLPDECYRVLTRGGIARIVLPDLEPIVQLHLSAVDCAVAGNEEATRRYDRLMLELYAQTAGTVSGGNMLCNAEESAVPEFSLLALESVEGELRKPDSLYMKARKPASAGAGLTPS